MISISSTLPRPAAGTTTAGRLHCARTVLRPAAGRGRVVVIDNTGRRCGVLYSIEIDLALVTSRKFGGATYVRNADASYVQIRRIGPELADVRAAYVIYYRQAMTYVYMVPCTIIFVIQQS